MPMVFYGTSAAEGVPNPYCRCRRCENARLVGGREIRRRSMFRVSEAFCIDLGADAFQLAIEQEDFYNLRHVLITHTHEDHFAQMMFNLRSMARAAAPEPLHFYFTDQAYDIVDFFKQSKPIIKGLTAALEERGVIALHRLDFYKTTRIGEIDVLPLKGNHFGNMGEACANYMLTLPDGRKLFYGLDTGWYLEETFEALEDANISLLISECTFGLEPTRGEHPQSHLDAYSNLLLFDELMARRAITADTKVYLTHIGQYATHQELTEFFAASPGPFHTPVEVAYDGMRIL